MRQIEITDNEILLLHRLLYRTREQANACKKDYGEKYESQADVDVELLEALLLKANAVAIVMRCADCIHWKIAQECRGWEKYKYGQCTNSIIDITIEGDAYVKSRETDQDAYCSNFEEA